MDICQYLHFVEISLAIFRLNSSSRQVCFSTTKERWCVFSLKASELKRRLLLVNSRQVIHDEYHNMSNCLSMFIRFSSSS